MEQKYRYAEMEYVRTNLHVEMGDRWAHRASSSGTRLARVAILTTASLA